jgi:hypothetical protein
VNCKIQGISDAAKFMKLLYDPTITSFSKRYVYSAGIDKGKLPFPLVLEDITLFDFITYKVKITPVFCLFASRAHFD